MRASWFMSRKKEEGRKLDKKEQSAVDFGVKNFLSEDQQEDKCSLRGHGGQKNHPGSPQPPPQM